MRMPPDIWNGGSEVGPTTTTTANNNRVHSWSCIVCLSRSSKTDSTNRWVILDSFCPETPAENEDDKDDQRLRDGSECYFAIKGTALVLPHDECLRVYRCPNASISPSPNNNSPATNDIKNHLQSMMYLLRPEDTLKMAVRLESTHPERTRYLAVVSHGIDNNGTGGNTTTTSSASSETYCLLGIDCNTWTTLGLVLPICAHTKITLDGDGGFSVQSNSGHHIFKPVSVQAMWSAIQSLHKACAMARQRNHFEGTSSHAWIEQYYVPRIESDQSCLNEWHAMADLISKRPPTPQRDRALEYEEKHRTEDLIRSKLKELMMSLDLDEVTSKYIRTQLEGTLAMKLDDYKSFIDQEMLTILGQMDAATEILEYLFLGSEWNASNLTELKVKGVGHILNVTREIDNFFPSDFKYHNVRVYDDEHTEMLQHWDNTYKIITRARDQGSKVLVHCKMGISRSASVVIAFLMKEYSFPLKEALAFVKDRRSCIQPNENFLHQLEVYQGILNANKNRHNVIWRSKSETNLKSASRSKSKSGSNGDGTDNDSMMSRSEASATTSNKDDPLAPYDPLGHFSSSSTSTHDDRLLIPGSVVRPKSWSPRESIPRASSDDEAPCSEIPTVNGVPSVPVRDRVNELELLGPVQSVVMGGGSKHRAVVVKCTTPETDDADNLPDTPPPDLISCPADPLIGNIVKPPQFIEPRRPLLADKPPQFDKSANVVEPLFVDGNMRIVDAKPPPGHAAFRVRNDCEWARRRGGPDDPATVFLQQRSISETDASRYAGVTDENAIQSEFSSSRIAGDSLKRRTVCVPEGVVVDTVFSQSNMDSSTSSAIRGSQGDSAVQRGHVLKTKRAFQHSATAPASPQGSDHDEFSSSPPTHRQTLQRSQSLRHHAPMPPAVPHHSLSTPSVYPNEGDGSSSESATCCTTSASSSRCTTRTREDSRGFVKRLTEELEAKAKPAPQAAATNTTTSTTTSATTANSTSSIRLERSRSSPAERWKQRNDTLTKPPKPSTGPLRFCHNFHTGVVVAPTENNGVSATCERKVRTKQQQGKTHPLSKLQHTLRHANPLYNTM